MKITLITACYNSVATIRTALESVLRQTWPELEYLVIDGGSTDGTVDILREYEKKFVSTFVRDCVSENADACADQEIRQSGNKALRQFIWVSEPDKGLYDALNKGIRMATGEVVGILNADDVLADDGVIERVASAFGKCVNALVPKCVNALVPECVNAGVRDGEASENRAIRHSGNKAVIPPECPDAVYGDIRFVANKTGIGLDALREEKTVRYYSSRLFRPWLARFGYMPAHPSFYCRRELFEKLGYYQADYKIAADHELLIRFLVKERVCCVYLPAALVVMRVGGMSTRSVESTMILNRENIRACKANGIYTNRLMQLGKYLFKIPGLIFKDGY